MSHRINPGVMVTYIDEHDYTPTITWVYQSKIRTFFANIGPYFGGSGLDLRDNKELIEWCDEHFCVISRAWIECPDEETAVMFKLRWT